MFMVDTSVWVDYFNGRLTHEVSLVQNKLGQELVIIGDLILAETLQGFSHEKHFQQAKRLFKHFPILSLAGEKRVIQAANHYRTLRKRGVTIRKTIDILIGSYCITEGIALLYSDKDFDPMVKYLGLRSASLIQ